MEKVEVLIDSGNFYHLMLKKLGYQEVDFDYNKFADFLANGREIIQGGKRFYVGTVRDKQDAYESSRAVDNQKILFDGLRKTGWEIKTSKLRTRAETIKVDNRFLDFDKLVKCGIREITFEKSREKGIDVKITVDLIIGALDKKYDTAILVSSDTDLMAAIQCVRKRFHKKIEYIGFSLTETPKFEATRPVKALIYESDIQRVLADSDIRKFIRTQPAILP